LKIALVCDWYLPRAGGLELHVHDLALQLGRLGHQVEVVTSIPGPAELEGIPVHRLDVPLCPRHRFALWPRRTMRAIERTLTAGRYDVVHSHGSIIAPVAYYGAFVAQRLGLPTVLTYHSLFRSFRPLVSLAAACVDFRRWPVAFSAVSAAVAAEMQPYLGGREIRILRNAVSPEDWRVPRVRRDPSELWVAAVGRLDWRKRPEALVAAVPRIRARLPPNVRLQVKMAGEGRERRALERQIRRLGLEDVVELLGHRSRAEVRDLLARADVLAMPSTAESFGIAAFEARCAGLPVVAFEQGGVGEFLRDGCEGFVVKDDEEMTDRLSRLLLDPALRSRMSEEARRVPPAFTWDRVLPEHLGEYQRAATLAARSLERSPTRAVAIE